MLLLVVELAQGAIGFVQYFTDLPIVLVGFHLLGAALISACVTWVLLAVREPSAPVERRRIGAAIDGVTAVGRTPVDGRAPLGVDAPSPGPSSTRLCGLQRGARRLGRSTAGPACLGQRMSGSSATATKSSDR